LDDHRRRFAISLTPSSTGPLSQGLTLSFSSRTEPMTEQANSNQNRPLTLDESKAQSCYANFCRVTGSPEEVIIDFGINAYPLGASAKPVEVSQRIVVNFYTAKRLLGALYQTIQRHEEVFGPIEVDVQKRVRSRDAGSMSGQA
jgi:hypothetical protein